MRTDLDAIEIAKKKVFDIFLALEVDREVVWKEYLRGFYRASCSLHGNTLLAEISRDGSFSIGLKSTELNCILLLYSQENSGVQYEAVLESSPRKETAKTHDSPVTLDSSPEAETSAKIKDKKP